LFFLPFFSYFSPLFCLLISKERAKTGEFLIKMVIFCNSLYYKELAARYVPLEKLAEDG
jgi:hypothetical protein